MTIHRRLNAHAKLDTILEYTRDGYLPEAAAAMAGYSSVKSARGVARRYHRTDVCDALRLPTALERRAHRAEDLDFLLSVGEHPERAIHRVGFDTLGAAIYRIRQWGYPELAARLLPPSDDTDDWMTAA